MCQCSLKLRKPLRAKQEASPSRGERLCTALLDRSVFGDTSVDNKAVTGSYLSRPLRLYWTNHSPSHQMFDLMNRNRSEMKSRYLSQWLVTLTVCPGLSLAAGDAGILLK
jgi:hypothetical protein